jgi:N-acetylglucosaminyldiphosphoundecaprenol N-acetyl-beta-D-mannosaminyltransferase
MLRGTPFDVLTEAEAAALLIERLQSGHGGRVVTPNIDILRQVDADSRLRNLVGSADLVLADGMPLVWAARLQGTPLPERVAGSALSVRLVGLAAASGLGLHLLGGNPGSAERAAGQLGVHHPGLRVGWHCPPFGFEKDDKAIAAIFDAVAAFGPAVYLVGLGFPKQDLLAADLHIRFPGSWFIGAGATVGFLAGEFDRAPRWMQSSGLEWIHRLVLEPGRLSERYLRHDLPFAVRLLTGAAVGRSERRRGGRPVPKSGSSQSRV